MALQVGLTPRCARGAIFFPSFLCGVNFTILLGKELSMDSSDQAAAGSSAAQHASSETKVADLLRFWNPEFLQHQLEHASVMDELPAVKVRHLVCK